MTPNAVLWSYALAPDVRVEPGPGGALLRTPTSEAWIEGEVELQALDLLVGTGPSESDLHIQLRQTGAADVEVRCAALLFQLDRLGLLVRILSSGGRRLASCVPHRPPPGAAPDRPPDGSLRLSRHAMARVDGHLMALEVPGAWAKVTIHDRDLLTLLHDLSIGRAASEMANQGSHPEEAILATLALMSWCELLENVNEEGWPAHELLFHSRTRRGYARVLLGKSDIAGESVGASDGSHGEGKGRIALELPDWSRLLAGDPPHALVADRRRSIRRQGSIPITSKQLSELLFRTLHEKEGRRPYPSGGACYPLNAYVAIHSCSGVPAGFYFYSPVRHELVTVSGAGPGVDRLVADAAGAANLDRLPQILLVLAARFTCTRRVYGDLGYSLILKEVGGVFQTALMAAAAMGLAACPLGCGDSLEFSRLTRVDPLIETSVGELILGSLGDVV